jgi:putative FmdB family regulatory protein
MPLYEYKCEGCGEIFEVKQKFSDEPLTVHDKCGGRLERLISAPALQFKGSGWYVTDYAKGGNGGKKSETKPASDSSAKSETKPAESKTSTSDKPKTD